MLSNRLLIALSFALGSCGSTKPEPVANNWDEIEGYSESFKVRVTKLEACKPGDIGPSKSDSVSDYVDMWGPNAKACREGFVDSSLDAAASALSEFEQDSVLGSMPAPPNTHEICTEGAAMMQSAGENSETCSPWKNLVRELSWNLVDWGYLRRLSFLTRMGAWNAVKDGKHELGLALLRNCISFGHHLARGGVTGFQMALANSVSTSCAGSVHSLLNSPHFRVSDWEAWAKEFRTIANSQPEPASTFLAERKSIAHGLPLTSASEEEIISAKAVKKAYDEVFISSMQGCESDWLSCYTFLENEKAQLDKSYEELRAKLGGETSMVGLKLSKKELMESTSLTLKSMGHTGGKFITAAIDHRRELSYIQVHLLFRAKAEKSRACPELETFSSPEFQALLRDPASSGMIEIAASTKGYELRPQMTAAPEGDEATVAPWLLSCESRPWEPSESSIAIAVPAKPSTPGMEAEGEELEESAPARSKETESLIAEIRAGIRSSTDDERAISANSLALLLDNPQALEMRITPSVKEGKANGFRLFGFRPGSLMNTLGFELGDTLLSINEKTVIDPGNMRTLMDSVKNKTETTYQVKILRRGAAHSLLFRLE